MKGRGVILDTSVLVALVDARDAQHQRAVRLVRAMESRVLPQLVLDCVVVETVGVLCRRREERRRAHALPSLPEIFAGTITRAYPLLAARWEQLLARVDESDGRINLHDALILAYALEYAVDAIATFDADFQQEPGTRCLTSPTDVDSLLGE